MRVSLFALGAAACLAAAGPAAAQAQSYPSKPIHVIVPFTTGSATDILARLVGERLNAAWGQPVLVENRPGAGGTIGTAQVAKALPDGYTLLVVSTGHVVNHVLYANLQYDTLKDFAGVAPLASLPSVLAVSPALGLKTVRELVAAAKAHPGAFNYGSAGVGSAGHINSEKFRVAAGIDAVHVPFKGTPEILSNTMGGDIQFAWVPIVSSLGPLRDGKLVPLAVSTPTRVAALPEVPTIAEAGYPGGEFIFWIGLLAPAQLPPDLLAKLNGEITRSLQSPEAKDHLLKLGAEPMSMTPAQFDRFIAEQYAELGAVMRQAGAKPQ